VAEIARLEDQVGYWKAELAKAAAGGAQVWDATTVVVGDKIRYWAGWHTVTKVNSKSVRLDSRTGRLPFDTLWPRHRAAPQTVGYDDCGRRRGRTGGSRGVVERGGSVGSHGMR